MIFLHNVKKDLGEYYLLQSMTDPMFTDRRRLLQNDLSNIREFRKILEIRDVGDKKAAVISSKFIIDMKNMNILSYSEDSGPCIVPISLLYRKASPAVMKAIELHLENRNYFIEGKIL